MTGFCASGDHKNCPDSQDDSYGCVCSCHVEGALAWLLARAANRKDA